MRMNAVGDKFLPHRNPGDAEPFCGFALVSSDGVIRAGRKFAFRGFMQAGKALSAELNSVHPEVGVGLNWRPGARLCRRPAAALGQGNALRLVEDDTAALPPTTSGCTELHSGDCN